MAEAPVFAICKNFAPELRAVLQELGDELPSEGIQVVELENSCSHPRKMQSILPLVERGHVRLFLGSCARPGLISELQKLEEAPCFSVDYVPFCFHWLIPPEMVRFLFSRKNFLLSPGWLFHWEDQVKKEWGFDAPHAKEFFAGMVSQYLVLDTGIRSTQEMQAFEREFSCFSGLDGTRMPVGLEMLRQRVLGWMRQNALQACRRENEKKIQEKNREEADLKMALELSGDLLRFRREEEFLGHLMEIVQGLFGASEVEFLTFRENTPSKWYRNRQKPLSAEKCPFPLSEIVADFHYTIGKRGFFLKLGDAKQTLGVMKVDSIAFPEHLNRYLNLALSLKGVFSMAFSHARQNAQIESARQELVQANAHLENQTARKRELVHILCHDLANPLSAIQSLCEPEGLEAFSAADFLRHVRSATEQSLALIQAVRNMESLERWSEKMVLEPLDLGEMVQRSLGMLHRQFVEKRVQVRISIPKELRFLGEPTLFVNTILNNLLTNALKFSYAGSQVEIHAKMSRTSPGETSQVLLEISDQGCGISEKQLETLFSGSRTRSTRGTSGEEGTGFGLPLVKRMVQEMRGEIAIESRSEGEFPGSSGTRVSLFLAGAGEQGK